MIERSVSLFEVAMLVHYHRPVRDTNKYTNRNSGNTWETVGTHETQKSPQTVIQCGR